MCALWEKAQAAERSKCKPEGDAPLTSNSLKIPGGDEQVRMKINGKLLNCTCDCCLCDLIYVHSILHWFVSNETFSSL